MKKIITDNFAHKFRIAIYIGGFLAFLLGAYLSNLQATPSIDEYPGSLNKIYPNSDDFWPPDDIPDPFPPWQSIFQEDSVENIS